MKRETGLANVMRHAPLVAPSMLKCDFGNLHREVELLEAAGAQMLHLDVMDGHFVPNLSYGPMVIERLRSLTDLTFDAHLMISQPARYLDEYIEAGCDWITIHAEAEDDPLPLLQRIRDAGRLAGLAFNPGTPVADIEQALPACDLVLVMSVEPGFGGQAFNPIALEKVRQVRQLAGAEQIISIDGGIGPSTIADSATAGANVFVVGSAIFDEPDYGAAISDLSARAQGTVV
ncbi:Ribulose-phosphate 3-epimerase [Maioricimonas rarisocia]|uniref:Ribulose-phosphate 3-epimerase n=1 Tax=Maioricimonas rarisocia TaxID=2528026 RepID=A0A517Z2N6_9PLAN|nr:ribulose-phosphate 3-epimerase [Maioricimonas rarisocia]QDU36744.1 Ribulose-phosphate 3-epimerase [Maioricimonas rarisocia]